MRGSALIPKWFRSEDNADAVTKPSWFNEKVTSIVQAVSGRACTHPIHTIVVIAILASTSYVGLLEGSLFDTGSDLKYGPGQVDVNALLEGARNLKLGEETSWRWQIDDSSSFEELPKVCAVVQDLCLAQS